MDESLTCRNCGEKLYRKCFLINDNLYCNSCMRLLFMKDVDDVKMLLEIIKDYHADAKFNDKIPLYNSFMKNRESFFKNLKKSLEMDEDANNNGKDINEEDA